MTENDISYKIRGSIFKVHRALGPGLLESVYEAALAHELIQAGLHIKTQVAIPVQYDDVKLDIGFRLDILVNNLVIIEIKSIEEFSSVHHKQLLTYMKLANIKLGLLVNFNTDSIDKGIIRKVNGLL
jgi:GxxExxY protein